MEVLQKLKMSEISKKKYTKWFDYDKIKNNVQIRVRREGDYLVIDGAGHRQSLRRYLLNEKIPAATRDTLPLLADGSHIMWVVGHRISEYYKVDEYTQRVLKVQLIGGKEDE
jgi:tRNA(Ile)-lysidine synthase